MCLRRWGIPSTIRRVSKEVRYSLNLSTIKQQLNILDIIVLCKILLISLVPHPFLSTPWHQQPLFLWIIVYFLLQLHVINLALLNQLSSRTDTERISLVKRPTNPKLTSGWKFDDSQLYSHTKPCAGADYCGLCHIESRFQSFNLLASVENGHEVNTLFYTACCLS